MHQLFCIIFLLVSTLVQSHAAFPGQADRIASLPGVPIPLTSAHYSGYLDSISGIKLHYWFIESLSKPESDPVILWLNGGPGCSSLYGLFIENGPIRLHPNGTFTPNPFSWNLRANILYLESPVWVGFSYFANTSNDSFQNTDQNTAQQNLAALGSFFLGKFPHLSKNDFYITGESYAGHYLPMLGEAILKTPSLAPSFKGLAIGNGLLGPIHAELTQFAYYHGLVDSLESQTDYVFATNQYNILADCTPPVLVSFSKAQPSALPQKAIGMPPCDGGSALESWLSKAEVQAAIHVSESRVTNWQQCTMANYQRSIESSMAPYLKMILASGRKVVIYNGDLDSMCDFITNRGFVNSLGYPKLDFGPWYAGATIGGFRTRFEGNLTLTTVRGAGHMVPFDKPEAALVLLNQFLLETPKSNK